MMRKTLMRQWQMLHMVPRHPSKIAVATLQQELERIGYTSTIRTIQRDLNQLSELFPLTSDERSKPYGWSWQPNSNLLDIPGMDMNTALAFWMAGQHLKAMLPQSTVRQLAPHFKQAKAVLDKIPNKSNISEWRHKLRVLHRGPQLKTPIIHEKVQSAVYDALLYGHRLEVDYCARHHSATKHYEVSPHGLVIKDGIAYLVCSLWDYPDIKLLLLHRMENATPIDKPSIAPDGFDLDAYISSGELDYAVGGLIPLKVRFSDHAARHLAERPLADDQTLTEMADGRMELEATVNDTAELRWWLLAFGDSVEVIAPPAIRDHIIDTISKMGRLYDGSKS